MLSPSSLQVYRSASLQVCRSASLQVCKSAGLQVCKSVSLQSAFVAHRYFNADVSVMSNRGIEWSHSILKCSQNLAFARIARKNYTGARLLVLAKILQLLASF